MLLSGTTEHILKNFFVVPFVVRFYRVRLYNITLLQIFLLCYYTVLLLCSSTKEILVVNTGETVGTAIQYKSKNSSNFPKRFLTN